MCFYAGITRLYNYQTHTNNKGLLMTWNSLFIVLFVLLPNLSSTNQDVSNEVPNKRIVCYYRVEESFRPYDIDPNLCTHLIYSYVVIKENFAFVAGKKGDLKFLGQLKQRNPDLKVIVSLRPSGREFTLEGSSVDHGNSSGLSIKTRLARKVQEFILRHDLDGVDLDWEFFRDSKEVSTKKDSLLSIVHLLRTMFSQLSSGNSVNDRLITVTTSKYPRELTDNYDFGNLHRYIDFVSVPAYNYDTEGKSVRHPSRLHGISDMENMDSLVDLVFALGLPADKLVMGAPAHGILYKLVNSSQTIPGSPAISWNYNEAIISHSKICAVRDNANWTMVREKDLTAPYIYFKDKWIGFDDEISLKLKTKYTVLRGLGGIALWAVNDDDPHGRCGYGPFPLLQTIRSVLILPTEHINQPYGRLSLKKPNRDNFGMGTSFVAVVEKYGNVERVTEEDEAPKDEANSLPCSETGYLRHPKDCSRFYRCVRYDDGSSDSSLIKFQYGCPQGLLFDDNYEICNWPSWSPPCNGSGEIMVVTKKTFSCPSYGYFQDPDNCEYFYYCSDFGKGHFQGYEFKCPFGLGFDEEKLLCNWKWLVRGCGTSEPDANGEGSANLDAILSNFPPSFISSVGDSNSDNSENSRGNGDNLAASEDDDLLARSDDSEEVKYIEGSTYGHVIPAEHRQFESERPKSRRSFARALKDHVTEFVGNVGSKVKTLFSGNDEGDSIERRDAPMGPGGPFGSWLSNINPFSGTPPAVIPLKDVIRTDREPRRPSGRGHQHKEPMVSIPVIDMSKPGNGANNRRVPEDKKVIGARHRGPKNPSVHYADVGPDPSSVKPNGNRDVNRPAPQPLGSDKLNRETIAVPVITVKEPSIQRRPDSSASSQNGLRPSQSSNQRNQPSHVSHLPEGLNKFTGPIPIPLPKEGLRVNNHKQVGLDTNQRNKQQFPSRKPTNHQAEVQNSSNQPPNRENQSNGGLQSSASIIRPQHVPQSVDHPKQNIFKGNQGPPQQRKPSPDNNAPNNKQQENRDQPQPSNQHRNHPNSDVKNIPGLDFLPGYEVDIKPLEVQEMLLNGQLGPNSATIANNPNMMKQASIILPGLREHVREHVRQHLKNQMNQAPPSAHHQIQPQPQSQPNQHHPHQQIHNNQPNQPNQHKNQPQQQSHQTHNQQHQQKLQQPINQPNQQIPVINVNPHSLPHQASIKPHHINQPTLELHNQQTQFHGRPQPSNQHRNQNHNNHYQNQSPNNYHHIQNLNNNNNQIHNQNNYYPNQNQNNHHPNQNPNNHLHNQNLNNYQNPNPNMHNGSNKLINGPVTQKPVNSIPYTQRPTQDTFYKSQGSGNYLAIQGHKQSHYGVSSPSASDSSNAPVNSGPQNANSNRNPTASAPEPLPISKNGFIPIQPTGSQFSPPHAANQVPISNLADNSKGINSNAYSSVNMQTSGSNNEYHYYSNPVDPMEVPNFVKIVELPTSSSPLPTTASNIKLTTTKKPQLLIIPVPDSHPQGSNSDEFEKLASMYPNLFPQGVDFKRITTTKRPFDNLPKGKPNGKDDVFYVVVDDKNKPIGGPIKSNGDGNQFGEGKVSFDELLRNPELLSALATQQGFNFDSLVGASGLGQRFPTEHHHNGLSFSNPQLPGNWIKHDDVEKSINEVNSQTGSRNFHRKPTSPPSTTTTTSRSKPITSTTSNINRRKTTTSTTTSTTTLPPVTQYEIKRTTKKPSKLRSTTTTSTTPTTTTITTTTTTTTQSPTTTSTSTTTPAPTTSSPPPSTTISTPTTSPSSLANGSLTTDENFFLGAQSIPQALYESIQAVIAQHLSQSGISGSTTTPSPISSSGPTTVNYDGSTIDSLRMSNPPISHQSVNNNNVNNQPPAYHSYYYQPPGSNETVVYGQGWPSYQPSWYQYAFPPSPIYPTGLNFTNPLGSPYYPLGSPYPAPIHPPHPINYQPQYLAGSSATGSAAAGSYFDLQYVTPPEVTTSSIFKTSEYSAPPTLSPNIHDKYGVYDGYDYHGLHGGYEAPIGSFTTDYIRSSTQPSSTTPTTSTTTTTTTTTATTTPPTTTRKVSSGTPTEYLTERPFDILRNKGDAPQIQVYIVQGANGPQVKTKTVHPHSHHQKVNDSPNVKVFVIDESKEPGQSESIQDISKTESPFGRPIGVEELDSVHEINDNSNNDGNNNYYSFSYETRPRSTTPTYPSYSTSTVKPLSESNVAPSPSGGANQYRDIEYEDETPYSGDSYNPDSGHLPASKVNSLQSLYNSNLYPGLRNFTDGSVPEAACTRPGLFQHPGDCNKFYECYWDKFINKFTLHLFECPVKLAFDSRIVGCSAPTDPTVCVQY